MGMSVWSKIKVRRRNGTRPTKSRQSEEKKKKEDFSFVARWMGARCVRASCLLYNRV